MLVSRRGRLTTLFFEERGGLLGALGIGMVTGSGESGTAELGGGCGDEGDVDFAGEIARGHLVLKCETMQVVQKSEGSGQVSLSM